MSDKPSDESNSGLWVGVIVIAAVLYFSDKCSTKREEYIIVPAPNHPSTYHQPYR